MNEGQLCSWADERDGKLYRCTSPATETVVVKGQTLYLCSEHASIVNRMIRRKEMLEAEAELASDILKAAETDINKAVALVRQLEQLVIGKRGQVISCPGCGTVFYHTGRLEYQICPKCGYRTF